MRREKYIIKLFVIALIVIGCKKIEPPLNDDIANDPIYKVNGLVDGDSLNLEVNGTTVFINAEPYIHNGVNAYSSIISDIENDFELKLVLIEPEILMDEDGAQLLNQSNIPFLVNEPSCMSFDFYSNNGSSTPINIDVNGSQNQGNSILSKIYGIYDGDISFPEINSQNYELPLKFGFENLELRPGFEIKENNNIIVLSADNQNINHNWFVDGDLASTTSVLEQQMSNGLHLVIHEVYDDYNNQASEFCFVYYENGMFQWCATWSVCYGYETVSNYGKVFIEVTKNNQVYSSLNDLTNHQNSLNVTNVEYAFTPSLHLDYVKFNLTFDADLTLQNSTQKMLLRDFEGTFIVKIE